METLSVITATYAFAKSAYGYFTDAKKTYDYIKRSVQDEPTLEDIVRDGFLRLSQELRNAEGNLSSLIQDASVRAQFGVDERVIRSANTAFESYMAVPSSDHWKDQFKNRASRLNDAVGTLLEGLLGRLTIHSDFLQVIITFEQKRPGKVKKRVDGVMNLIDIGLALHAVHIALLGLSQEETIQEEDRLVQLYIQVTTRIEQEIQSMENQSRVAQEMRDIMEKEKCAHFTEIRTSDDAHESLSRKLFDFLTERYDTKKWLVVVYHGHGHHNQAITGSDHHWVVNVSGRSALAKSFPRNDQEFHPFTVPRSTIPEENGGFWKTLLADIRACLNKENAQALSQLLSASEPRNDYIVFERLTLVDSRDGFSLLAYPSPVILSQSSHFARVVDEGWNFRIVAFPK